MTSGKYDGKFVCWGNADGGFCFARIMGEATVGTATGEQEVFVVTDRISRSAKGEIYRDDRTGKKTTIRKSVLKLERDVFDRKQGMEDLTDDQLFMLALAGKADAGVKIHCGVANMLEAEMGRPLEELARVKLKDRLVGAGS